jgi:hypothetical protein
MAQQFARLPTYKLNLGTGWTNDNLVLIDQRRHLVALVEHAIDPLACPRASEDDVAFHITSSQQSGTNG